METLRWKHLRVPACASPAGRHWPQSLVGNTVPMRAARPPRKGRRSMSSTVMAHLGELGGGLRAGHAAADHDDRVVALGVGHRVGRGVRVERPTSRRCARPCRSPRRRRRRGPSCSPRGCRRSRAGGRARRASGSGARRSPGAAGEDEAAGSPSAPASISSSSCAWPSRLHQCAPRMHVGVTPGMLPRARSKSMFFMRAGALAEEHERTGGLGGLAAGLIAPTSPCDGRGRARLRLRRPRLDCASAGQPRAQVPQPRHFSSS